MEVQSIIFSVWGFFNKHLEEFLNNFKCCREMAKKKSKRQVPIWSRPLAIRKRPHLKISVYLSALNAPLLSYPGELFANRCQDISSPNVWAILYLMHLRKGRIMSRWNWGKGKIKICWLGQENPNFWTGLDLNILPNLTFCPQPLFLFYPRLARRVLSQSPSLLAPRFPYPTGI